jgi:hypothetical protein
MAQRSTRREGRLLSSVVLPTARTLRSWLRRGSRALGAGSSSIRRSRLHRFDLLLALIGPERPATESGHRLESAGVIGLAVVREKILPMAGRE